MIRSRNAVLVISFLFDQFKGQNPGRRSNIELIRKLGVILEDQEEVNLEEDDGTTIKGDFNQRSKRLLEIWTNKGFISKYSDTEGEDWHELTQESEKALLWVEELLDRIRFVGTESRFKDIYQKIKSLVSETTEDPIKKIEELETEKAAIEKKIEYIRTTGHVETLSDTQIEERFVETTRMGKALVSDFREVEKNFQDIGKEIYEKQSERLFSKGSLLGIALDSFDELKEKDQGKSFYAFWEFLQSDASTDEFRKLIERLFSLLKERNIQAVKDNFLKYLKRNLHEQGKRVLESNDMLAEKLNRILAEKSVTDRMRALELIHEIRQLALKTIDTPPEENEFLIVDTFSAEIKMPGSRDLTFPGEEENIRNQAQEGEPSMDFDLAALFDQFYVDIKELEGRIRQMLQGKDEISLSEITNQFPPTKGLAEILTYYSIATNQPRSSITRDEMEYIALDTANSRIIKVPKLIFSK